MPSTSPNSDLAPEALARIDSFLYRHRVRDVMSGPLVTVDAAADLLGAVRSMRERGVSSVVAVDPAGRATGILTERDLLRAVAARGKAALDDPVQALMSRPVQSVRADAFVYTALGRMDRLNVRHLVAVDADQRAIGMITRRALLKLRAGQALVLGDRIAAAADAATLAEVKSALPALAEALLAEGVNAIGAAAVIAGVVRDLTAHAAELAERDMQVAGHGAAPAPWCVLVLGSGGRGESLLAADQDNAILHAGSEQDDAWFAEAGARIADILNAAGIPYCKGGVMAKNPHWRHSLGGWGQEIDGWIRKKEGESLLNVDIFFDFQPVYGERGLAAELRHMALEATSRAPLFLRLLAANLENIGSPLGFFGGIRTEKGRFDIKLNGFLPIVAAARVMALRHRVEATATLERLSALAGAGAIPDAEAQALAEAYEVMLGTLLQQQIRDIAAGIAPSTRVEPRALDGRARARLREALRQIDGLVEPLREALSQVRLGE